MTGLDLDSATSVFGRIVTLASAYGMDVSALLDRLTPLAPELAQEMVVTVPNTFDRIAVGTQIRRGSDAVDRARALSRSCDPTQPSRLEALAGAETRDLAVEIESVTGDAQAFALTVTGYGKRALAADLAVLAGFGVTAEVVARLETLTTTLVGESKLIGLSDRADTRGARVWTVHVAHRNSTAEQRAAARRQLGSVASSLQVTGPQRNVVDGLHEAFADGRDSYSWLRIREHDPAIELGVLWANVRWEDVVNVMMNFYPKANSQIRLGELAGAFGADAAAGVEIELGPTEPPRMRVAVSLTKGRPQS